MLLKLLDSVIIFCLDFLLCYIPIIFNKSYKVSSQWIVLAWQKTNLNRVNFTLCLQAKLNKAKIKSWTFLCMNKIQGEEQAVFPLSPSLIVPLLKCKRDECTVKLTTHRASAAWALQLDKVIMYCVFCAFSGTEWLLHGFFIRWLVRMLYACVNVHLEIL